MKRVIICAVLLLGCVISSVYSTYKAESTSREVSLRIEAMGPLMQNGDYQELSLRASELFIFWDKEEDTLAHFVRHSHLDLITVAMSRLPSLAAFEEMGEFSAELASIQRQMEHIRDTERIKLVNLF